MRRRRGRRPGVWRASAANDLWNRYRMSNQRARKGRFPSLEGEVSGSRVRGLGRTDLGYGSEGSAPQAQPSPSVQERAVGAESLTSGNRIEDLDSDLEGPDAEVFRVWGSPDKRGPCRGTERFTPVSLLEGTWPWQALILQQQAAQEHRMGELLLGGTHLMR